MKRVACYIRVSSQEQAEHGFSIGEQKERLIAYCKAKDFIIHEIYIDPGYSGSNLDRPAIKKLKADIKNFEIVVVYKLDRLSRSQFDILDLIENYFLPNNVDFISMSEAFDTSTPFGRAMIGILGVFAQLEREQIKERSTMGRMARAKEGKWHGGAACPVGYNYKDGILSINEYEAEQIRLVFNMVANGESNQIILDTLNKNGYKTQYGSWNDASKISRIIKKDVYLGTITYGNVITPNSHEPIIDYELFMKANEARNRKREIYGYTTHQRTKLLSGFLWCAKCGARYGTTISRHKKCGEPVTSSNSYHACYSRAFPNSKMAVQKGCSNKIWRIDKLEEAVDIEIKKLIFEEGHFEKLVNRSGVPKQNDISVIEKKIIDIDKQIGKLVGLYSLEKIPLNVLSAKIDGLQKDKNLLEKQIEVKKQPTKNASLEMNIEQFFEILKTMSGLWGLADMEQKRKFLSMLIKRIVINDDELKFEWVFL